MRGHPSDSYRSRFTRHSTKQYHICMGRTSNAWTPLDSAKPLFLAHRTTARPNVRRNMCRAGSTIGRVGK